MRGAIDVETEIMLVKELSQIKLIIKDYNDREHFFIKIPSIY